MDKPRRTTETSGSDCRELGGRLKPVADWAASRQPEARAAKRRPSVSTASTIQRDKFWGAPPVMLWCCDLRFAVNPHGVGKKSSVLMASCNDLIKRNRDFENINQERQSVPDAESVAYRLPNWQHAHRYSRILGKSITRTNPFWLVNVSVWSALCACATPEMR